MYMPKQNNTLYQNQYFRRFSKKAVDRLRVVQGKLCAAFRLILMQDDWFAKYDSYFGRFDLFDSLDK